MKYFILLFVAVGVAYFWVAQKISSPILQQEQQMDTQRIDIPFKELTIPYLRARSYKSSLQEKTLFEEKESYTSYLTSYDSDGLTINALLTVPKEAPPVGGYPAIVFVHGYIPPAVYTTTGRYTDYVDYLARNGFVVLKIDLRGHGKSEGIPSGAYYSGDYVIDTLHAYSALQSYNLVNPDAVGLWGHSMAGNVTMRAFVANQKIPALVIWAGAVYSYEDLTKYRLNDNSYRPPSQSTERQKQREALRAAHGDFSPESDFWDMVVPLHYLEGVTGAVELHHAVNDDVVNVGYSRDLAAALEKAHIPHTLYEYQTGGHNLSGGAFSQAMERTVTFFKSHLSGVE